MGEDDKASEVVLESDNQALVVLESAKELMNEGYYCEAADSIKLAMELCPSVENGFGMLIISETLRYANILFQHEEGLCEFDYYSVLHLHSSSTEAEIITRFEDLVNELTHISSTHFSEHLHTILLINHSKSELCHPSLRPKFNESRMKIILFERPISRQKASFREEYLNWKPPMYCYNVAKHHRLVPEFMDMGLLSYPRFVKEEKPSSPCEEFRYLTKHVFDKMPQRPHYEMLSVLFQGKILEGMKLVLDVAYVNLVEEIQKVTSPPQMFSHKLKDFEKDLKQLSSMGYNVDKLQEIINPLTKISNRDQATRVLMKQTKNEVGTFNSCLWLLGDETRKCKNEVKKLGSRLSDLNAETGKCKDEVSNLDSRLLELGDETRKCKDEVSILDSRLLKLDDETQECKNSIEEQNLELQGLEIELDNVLSEFELATQSSMWE